MINKNLKIALIALVLVFISEFIAIGITFFGEFLKMNFVRNYYVNTLISTMCIITLQYIFAKIYSNNVIEFVGMKFGKKSLKQLLVGIVIGILLGSIWVFVLRLIKFIDFKGASSIYYTNIIIGFFAAISVGVVEEIVFRGIILNQLMQFKGEVFAIIISSIIFGLLHTQYYGEPIVMCYVFIFGAVLGGLYIITKSLYLSIGLHFAADFLLFVAGEIFILNKTVSSVKLDLYLACIQSITLLLMLTFIIIIRMKHYTASRDSKIF